MKIQHSHIAIVIWALGFIPMGFSESYPNRPTAYELEGFVISGTQCAKGINERCWATQYSTNPAQYRVSPLTNNSCWYLDQNLMGILAINIKALVSNYVNQATVYAGTTNITMLTVPGLWAELGIGDHINKFTLTPVSGTNSATYGDGPWRIYQENLDERLDVLKALELRLLGSYAGTSFPEVVRTATVWGEGSMATGGYCRIWYSLNGTDLGPANETAYAIEVDTRNFSGSGGVDYISLGWGGSAWGFNSDIFQMSLDTSVGSGIASFSAGLTLNANPNIIKIWNCMLGNASNPEETALSYSDSTVEISADLDRTSQEVANFGFYAVIDFPFQYCPDE